VAPLTEAQIRKAFVNQSKGQSTRMNLPDLSAQTWEDLDFLGWFDPRSPTRTYLVTERACEVRGVAMRITQGAASRGRKSMCDLCLTVGPVALMVAPRAGRSGQQGDSVGLYACTDLACSLYVRNKRKVDTPVVQETLTVDQRVARLTANVDTFLARVTR